MKRKRSESSDDLISTRSGFRAPRWFTRRDLMSDDLPVIGMNPAPKPLSYRQDIRIDMRLLLLFAALCGLGLVVEVMRASYFEANAVTVSGFVTNVYAVPNYRGGERYYVEYTYTAGNRDYAGQDQVGSDIYAQLYAASRVDVRYIPNQPEWSHVPGVPDEPFDATSLFAIFGVLFLIFAGKSAGVLPSWNRHRPAR